MNLPGQTLAPRAWISLKFNPLITEMLNFFGKFKSVYQTLDPWKQVTIINDNYEMNLLKTKHPDVRMTSSVNSMTIE